MTKVMADKSLSTIFFETPCTFIHKFREMCSKLSKLNKKLRFILLSKKKKMILFTVRAGCLRRSVSQWREKINLPVIRIC